MPAELRISIYEMLVVFSKALQAEVVAGYIVRATEKGAGKDIVVTKMAPTQPCLALVNRRLRAEVLHIFYSRNTFIFTFFKPGVHYTRFFKWGNQLNLLALGHLAKVTLTKRIDRCVGGYTHRTHGHLYSISLVKRQDHGVDVNFRCSAADFCSCTVTKACSVYQWTKKTPDCIWFARIVNDVEGLALADFKETSCAFAARETRSLCGRCGKLAGIRPVGNGMLYNYGLTADEQ